MRTTAAGHPLTRREMSPKHHPTLMSGGDRKALSKELRKSRAMTGILAAQSDEMRSKAEALIKQADRLSCESWNERMWSDGESIDPSPTIDQAINGGLPLPSLGVAVCWLAAVALEFDSAAAMLGA